MLRINGEISDYLIELTIFTIKVLIAQFIFDDRRTHPDTFKILKYFFSFVFIVSHFIHFKVIGLEIDSMIPRDLLISSSSENTGKFSIIILKAHIPITTSIIVTLISVRDGKYEAFDIAAKEVMLTLSLFKRKPEIIKIEEKYKYFLSSLNFLELRKKAGTIVPSNISR